MSTTFAALLSTAATPRLWLIRLRSASLLTLPVPVLQILLTDCLDIGAVVLLAAERVAVVFYVLLRVTPSLAWRYRVLRYLLTRLSV